MIVNTNTYPAAAAAAAAKSLQSCPTLCDPIDVSSPGSPIPGILQARTLEWGAIAFSRIRWHQPANRKEYQGAEQNNRLLEAEGSRSKEIALANSGLTE